MDGTKQTGLARKTGRAAVAAKRPGAVEIGLAKRLSRQKPQMQGENARKLVHTVQAFSTQQLRSFDRKHRRNTESQQPLQ
ncbi:hypothetical protein [Vandammella animalimorsus]|uniref:hypothetical protein n=1 Tax=Vandammella animalimorsus TaxID=2029117 RepID=UPI001177CE2C|nr:hypothetical protein [Vandammella animalimorsus]